MRGPMSLIVSGCLGVSDFGNGSHYDKCVRLSASQAFEQHPT